MSPFLISSEIGVVPLGLAKFIDETPETNQPM